MFAINHNGKFTYKADTSKLPLYDDEGYFLWEVKIPWDTPVLSVNYTSYFGSEILVERPGYKVEELEFAKNSDFYSYPNIIKYYINGTVKDYCIILIIGTGLFLIILFLKKYIKIRRNV